MNSQDSTRDQIRRIVERAVEAGEYDAVDWILSMWAEHSKTPLYNK